MIESHKRVLCNVKAICDGQLTLLRTHELASKMRGEAQRGAYLSQMEMLCQQQRLLACQLHDIVLSEKQQLEAEAATS